MAVAVAAGVGALSSYFSGRQASSANRRAAALEQEQLALARDQDKYKRGLVDAMLTEANPTQSDYDTEAAAAGADAEMASLNANEASRMRMARYGLSPASGAALALDRQNTVLSAANKAGAQTLARRYVTDRARTARTQARMAGLGLGSATLNVEGNQALTQRNRASMLESQASNELGAGLGTAGYLYGQGAKVGGLFK